MATEIQLDALLVRTPGICGGLLHIDGTRVTVLQIATLYKRGESPEEIGENFPQLSLGQVYAALAYYHTNRAEIDQELADEENEFDRLQAAHGQTATPQ